MTMQVEQGGRNSVSLEYFTHPFIRPMIYFGLVVIGVSVLIEEFVYPQGNFGLIAMVMIGIVLFMQGDTVRMYAKKTGVSYQETLAEFNSTIYFVLILTLLFIFAAVTSSYIGGAISGLTAIGKFDRTLVKTFNRNN